MTRELIVYLMWLRREGYEWDAQAVLLGTLT